MMSRNTATDVSSPLPVCVSASYLRPRERIAPVRVEIDSAVFALLGGGPSGTATATWRKRLASKGISREPRRCPDGGRSVPLLIPGFGHHGAAALMEAHADFA